jgi:hypothetical protein
MNFVNAVINQSARTENGMLARQSTANANVDLFFAIGASRGKDIVPQFVSALVENREWALRIAQWARDVRGGAGERQIFRDIVAYLEVNDIEGARALMAKIPEIGRWDDLFSFNTLRGEAFALIAQALKNGNGLCAKWMPRQGADAVALRNFLGFSPKRYRKTLVTLTKVVEQQMCAREWSSINFEHVPSLASARYKKAFSRNAPEQFGAYVEKLNSGEAKVNASAVYPYDVLKGVEADVYNSNELNHVVAQWNALPNYVGDASVLPLVDVSGSMTCLVGGNKSLTCMDVAVSLGLYLADKNQGVFKDVFLTFSADPELLHLQGNVVQKMHQMKRSEWGMNTDLVKAIKKILQTAVEGRVPQADMPRMLLVLSDMQFDADQMLDMSAYEVIGREYQNAGYEMPAVVFWNLNANDNVPVCFDQSGVAMVSGFSPVIMKAVLGANIEELSPMKIMLDAVMVSRYDI